MVETILGGLIGVAIGSLIGAVFVRVAAQLICNFVPPYWMAYKAAFAASMIGFVGGVMADVLFDRAWISTASAMAFAILGGGWAIGHILSRDGVIIGAGPGIGVVAMWTAMAMVVFVLLVEVASLF